MAALAFTLKHSEQFRRYFLCEICGIQTGWSNPALQIRLPPDSGREGFPGLAPKQCLYVFDFVDNAGRYNTALSLHRLLGRKDYQPGALLFAPPDELHDEQTRYGREEKSRVILDLALEALAFEEIDLFNWQEVVRDMLTAADLDRELAVAEGTVRRALERGQIGPADHTLELGDRTYFYFSRQRVWEIRQGLGIEEVTAANVKRRFFEFVEEMDMSASYKSVLMLAFLEAANNRGRARMADVVKRFRAFHEERAKSGLAVERSRMRMARVTELSEADIPNVIVSMPLRMYQQRRYLEYSRDVAWLQFNMDLWKQCTDADLADIRQLCQRSIARYFERLTPGTY